MKRIIVVISGLILLALLLWFGIQWAVNGGWPASGAVQEAMPIHIHYVKPADGTVATDSYTVCAHFDYEAGRGLGDEPEKVIRFFLDGRNVTKHVVDMARLEYGYPVPTGEPCYQQHVPLRPGWHTAKITYKDVSGERFEYKWRFAVVAEE